MITEVHARLRARGPDWECQKFENVAAVAALNTPFRDSSESRAVRLPMRRNWPAVRAWYLTWRQRLCRLLRPAFRFTLIGSTIFLTAGCATIAPRNVLPQANAGQIELEGFHNIRFWGDASARDIQAIMMADAPKAETKSLGVERHQPVSNLLAISGGAAA